MERAVKGVYFLGLIKQLKIWQRQAGVDEIPGLTPEDHVHFTDGSIMLSSWYPLENFLRVLEAVFKLVYGGTPEGLKKMGIDSANAAAGGPQRRMIKDGDPRGTLDSLPVYWSLSYNFGQLTVRRAEHDYLVSLDGYSDIPRVHALLHLGYINQLLILAGANGIVCEAVAKSWEDSDDFVISVFWQGLK